ncbi:MAG: TonB-dependent receptor [Bdellovibrionales bacterium]
MAPPFAVCEEVPFGRVLVVTFYNGQPQSGVVLNGSFGQWISSTEGVISQELKPGHYQAVIQATEQKLEFDVTRGEETQVTVQLTGPKQAEMSLMQPVALNKPAHAEPAKEVSQTRAKVENELEDVVVLAPKIKGSVSALVEVRRKSSNVTDVLGAEQMARAGDSDAAASLRRVTGLTLMNGKYVYVRGLGERYSGVRMNGFSLPSPEPSRRVVPMDLFPTSILESVIVQKSYSPDLPGEFGGGLIQLNTKSIPEKYYVKASVSTTIENRDGQASYRGGSLDWMGADDGSRKLPGRVKRVLESGAKIVRKQPGSDQGLSDEELIATGQSFKNTYNVKDTNKQPIPGLTLAIGNQYKVAGAKVGAAASVLYGQDIDTVEKKSFGYNKGAGGNLERYFDKSTRSSETTTRLATNVDLGADLSKNHQVRYSTFLLRHTTDLTKRDSTVEQVATNITIEKTTLDWTERQLWTHHLTGQHNLQSYLQRPYEIKWRAGLADSSRTNPDRREYAFERTTQSYQMRSDSNGNRRTWSDLTDKSREVGLDITIPLSRNVDKAKLRVGSSYATRDRRSEIYRFTFLRDWAGDAPVNVGASPEEQFAPDNIGPGKFLPQNLTDAADSYAGHQSIRAYYAMVDYAPTPKWSFQGGARMESSVQRVETFKYYSPSEPFAESQLKMDDTLPAYAAVWKPTNRWRSRLAYSETLARPDFREMSTVGFLDDETDYIVQGNENLRGTVIKNYDHRWEYYWTTDEYLSLGAFYKKFKDPIEVMFVPGVNRIQSFDNAKGADNYGLELETRTSLRHVTRFLRRWTVAFNRTWITSEIELNERNQGVQTSRKRPLQGQAPYTWNFQLQYDRPLWGFSGTFLVNAVGRRITEVGTNGIPDTYEEPNLQADVVLSQKVAKNWSAGFKFKNIFDPEVLAKQEDQTVRSYRRGSSIGVGLSGVF